MSVRPDWIAVDWGTSRLRAWAMAADGTVLDRAASADGMGGLEPDAFEGALLRLAGPWLAPGRATPVLACGMVGARQGWIEAPYRRVPCAALATDALTRAPAVDPRLDFRIVPGLCQDQPPDVMRGEETQIAGFLAETAFDGTICLPGTHTKWVEVHAGQITGFRTIMSGEVFALLSGQSILRHSLGTGWDEAAFLAAARAAEAAPERALADLFALRARGLLGAADPDAARATLSGLLIGAELAAAAPGPGPIALVGTEGPAAAYRAALTDRGHEIVPIDAERATLRGLTRAYTAGRTA